ncbi:MAG TPA: PilZ domain-containing protein [Candidatus Baltobacteraceae bacterium]|nr:PilZ domain-containing protein [Candidatus Baltobacteraceae bacterium]
MSNRERRDSPRKECAVPLRFRILANGNGNGSHSEEESQPAQTYAPKVSSYSPSFEGKALNLSERGLYFTAREKLSVGAPLEIYLTIPRELTGRGPEPVRCKARVVHVDEMYPQQGVKGVGAIVDRYETIAMSRNWGN